MNYEEEYKAALERAKRLRDSKYQTMNAKRVVEEIFPELAESEDERIRKSIMATIEQCPDDFLNPKNRDRMLAWLEKQKEQEHICDSAQFEEGFKAGLEIGLRKQKEQEPRKFKSGEKVHRYDDDTNVITITGFRDDAYLTDSAYGPILFCDEDNWERIEQKPAWSKDNIKELTEFEAAMLHIGMSFFGGSAGLNPNNTNEVKKQAKLLLELVPKQEWSEEDERLCNLIAKCIALGRKQGLVNDDDNITCLDLLMRKGTSWSMGDEKMLKLIISELEQEGKDVNAPELYKIEIDWLKSLRPSWKPSEEQMEALKKTTQLANFGSDAKRRDALLSLYEQLKKL